MNTIKDFTATKETISLHGLGFIQLVLGGDQRMHVWHPDLPRRACYEHSAIHNHRFSFTSRVLKGLQKNVRCDLELAKEGSHVLISHNGPRSDKGGRESYPVAECNVFERPMECYEAGTEYSMPEFEYHYTPCEGMVVTLIKKHSSGKIHANSVCRKGIAFHHEFDRFQLSPQELFEFVIEALNSK